MRYLMGVTVLTILLLAGVLSPVNADQSTSGDGHHMSPVTGSKGLERMKSLAGTWHGTTVIEGKEMPVSVIYKTTSNGSAVVETLLPGTPQEMVSVYYDDGDKLHMTHYCGLDNQPEMIVEKSTDNNLDFTYVGGTNIDPEKTEHMHGLSITIQDRDNMVQEWKLFQDGKEKGVTTLTLTRVN